MAYKQTLNLIWTEIQKSHYDLLLIDCTLHDINYNNLPSIQTKYLRKGFSSFNMVALSYRITVKSSNILSVV